MSCNGGGASIPAVALSAAGRSYASPASPGADIRPAAHVFNGGVIMSVTHHSAGSTATASEIREIVGPMEDEVIAQILDIGPTSAEVLDAYTWLRADDRQQIKLERELHGKAARVLEILEQEESDGDD